MRLNKILCIVYAVVLLLNVSPLLLGFAGSQEEQKIVSEQKEMVTRIIKVQYADAKELTKMLSPFITVPRKGALSALSANEKYNTISVRDYPEKIAVMEEVIKQFDIKPAGVEFTFHLLEATDMPKPAKPVKPVEPVPPAKPVKPVESVPPAKPVPPLKAVPPIPPLPPDVQKVVEKLQTNFTYKYYHLLDSALLKSSESKSSSSHLSLGGSSKYLLDFKWSILSADSPVINISHFDIIRVGKDGGPLLHTSLLIEDGETAVVGISNSASDDTALVTIIKARILKDKK